MNNQVLAFPNNNESDIISAWSRRLNVMLKDYEDAKSLSSRPVPKSIFDAEKDSLEILRSGETSFMKKLERRKKALEYVNRRKKEITGPPRYQPGPKRSQVSKPRTRLQARKRMWRCLEKLKENAINEIKKNSWSASDEESSEDESNENTPANEADVAENVNGVVHNNVDALRIAQIPYRLRERRNNANNANPIGNIPRVIQNANHVAPSGNHPVAQNRHNQLRNETQQQSSANPPQNLSVPRVSIDYMMAYLGKFNLKVGRSADDPIGFGMSDEDNIVLDPPLVQDDELQPEHLTLPTPIMVALLNMPNLVINPRINRVNNPVVNPAHNPVINQVNNPVANPARNPLINPIRNPIVNPARNPIINPVQNLAVNPARNPIINPVQNPAINPVDNPVVNPVDNPVVHPVHNPVVNPARQNLANGQAVPLDFLINQGIRRRNDVNHLMQNADVERRNREAARNDGVEELKND